MLGRKTYTQEELDHAEGAVAAQLAAYERLVAAIDAAGADPEVKAALAAFEPHLFNNLTLALDRRFVHRVRLVAGKDNNPLNEVELLSDSLMDNGGVLRTNNVIKFVPDQSVLKLEPGEKIALGAAEFERLSNAFLGEIRSRFM